MNPSEKARRLVDEFWSANLRVNCGGSPTEEKEATDSESALFAEVVAEAARQYLAAVDAGALTDANGPMLATIEARKRLRNSIAALASSDAGEGEGTP